MVEKSPGRLYTDGMDLLPIGVQSFEKMRSTNYSYVDKTRFIEKLIQNGSTYFLSRPRRFGKSLLLDTLDCLFSGRRKLFEGLYIEKRWNWEKKYPVLRLDWSGYPVHSPEELSNMLEELLDEWSREFGISPRGEKWERRFSHFVEELAKNAGRGVVILVDEYDKPILDHIDDPKLAMVMRERLKDFYGTFKSLDASLGFVFITGVSKFSKAGIFSGLNNLNDITIDVEYSELCGYTQGDLETVFLPYLKNYDREKVRRWYNGYSWGDEAVYNPFDVLLLFSKKEFRAYWFATGTPSFLLNIWERSPNTLPDLDGIDVTEDLLDSNEIDCLTLEALLFQSGYLTIKDRRLLGDQIIYRLGYPNQEVKSALSRLLLHSSIPVKDTVSRQVKLNSIFEEHSSTELRQWFESFFASIPHDWYRKNPIANYEGYYESLIYAIFASLGCEVIPEDTTNKGRIDLTVHHRKGVWIFEFKVTGLDRSGATPPLDWIKKRGYAEKYRSLMKPIFQIGIVFDSEKRNIVSWEEELLEPGSVEE